MRLKSMSLVHNFFHGWKNALQGLLPRRQSTANLVLIQALKHITPQTKPGTVWVIVLHHLPPDRHGQSESRLPVPGNLSDLERSSLSGEKDGSAKQQREWDLAVFQRVKVFGRCYVEIKRAGNLQIYARAADERGNDDTGVCPQTRA